MKAFQVLIDFLLENPEFPIEKIFDGHFDELYEKCKREIKEFKIYECYGDLYDKIEEVLKTLNVPLDEFELQVKHPDGCPYVFYFGKLKAERCCLPRESIGSSSGEYCKYHTYSFNRSKRLKEERYDDIKPDETDLIMRRTKILSVIERSLTCHEFDRGISFHKRVLGFSDYDEFIKRQNEILNEADSNALYQIESLIRILPNTKLMDKEIMIESKTSGLVFNKAGEIVFLCNR